MSESVLEALEAGSRSAEALDLLASWAATPDEAGAERRPAPGSEEQSGFEGSRISDGRVREQARRGWAEVADPEQPADGVGEGVV